MTEHFRSRTQRYLAVVLRAAVIAIVVFSLTTFIGSAVIENVLTKLYTAKAAMEVKPRMAIGSHLGGDADTGFSADFQMIESPDVLQPVIADLSLDRIWAERIFHTGEPLSANEALKYLEQHLSLNYKRGTDVVEVMASSDDPKEAADVANGIADSYKKVRDAEDAGLALRGRQVLSDEIAEEQKVVEGKEAELRKLDATPSPGASGSAAKAYRAKLGQETSLLSALIERQKENGIAASTTASPVRILSRAEVPTEPSRPDTRFCYAVTYALAGLLSVLIPCSVEVVFLISRAAEDADRELLPAR